jgi:hypothetical protein
MVLGGFDSSSVEPLSVEPMGHDAAREAFLAAHHRYATG